MPQNFNDCDKAGGKVITKKLKNGKYVRVCFDKKGNSHIGEVKKKEKNYKKIVRKAELTKEGLMALQKLINGKYHN